MKKRNIVFVFLILTVSFFLTSCFKKGNTDDPVIEKPIEKEGYFQYYYTSETYEKVSTETKSLEKRLITRMGYTFEGVFAGENGSGIQYFDTKGERIEGMEVPADSNLYAKWTIKTYQLKLMIEEVEFKSIETTYRTVLTILETPVREGYTFKGWTDKEGTLFSDSMGYVLQNKKGFTEESGYSFDENENTVELYASFEIKEYTITFDYLGKGENTTHKVKHGESLTLPIVEDYDDYECLGWSYQSPTGEKYYENEPVTGDMTLYANWMRYKALSVIYEGKVLSVIRLYQDGRSIKVEDVEVDLPKGYEIEGWYRNASFSGNSEITSLSYGMRETEVYLDLKLIVYQLNLSLSSDESLDGGQDTYNYTCMDEFDLPAVTKENYSFVGWCFEEELTSKPITKISKGQIGNITLYPKFKGDNKTVYLDAREGTISLNSAVVEYGAFYSLRLPVWEEKAFLGWFYQKGTDEIQMTDNKGNSLQKWDILDSETTLYAKYTTKYYIAIQNKTMDFGNITSHPYYIEGEEVVLTAQPKEGYMLVGYYENNQLVCEELEYKFTMPARDVTIIIEFRPKEYTSTYDVNGGTLVEGENSEKVLYGETLSLPLVQRLGYEFAGWKANERVYEDSVVWEFTSDVVFVAEWTEVKDAYIISTISDFNNVKNHPNGNFFLDTDLDLTTWSLGSNFGGTFNGMGHTLTGIVQGPLFGTVTGEVFNLTIQVDITSSSTSGFKQIGGLVKALNGGKVHDVVVEGKIQTTGYHDTGGIIGFVSGSGAEIYNCINKANVSGTHTNSGGSTGGIVGAVQGENVRFENNENQGKVNCSSFMGGLVGFTNKTLTIKDCTHSGIVNATAAPSGGIIGRSEAKVTIDNCKVLGEISSVCGKYAGNTNITYLNMPTIEISNLSDFLRLFPMAMSGEKYILLTDIDLANSTWENMSISNISLDGEGHTICGLSEPLFKEISGGEVCNLTIVINEKKDFDNTSKTYCRVGGLAGILKNGKVHDIIVEGSIDVNGYVDVGGVIGFVDGANSEIYNCVNMASIRGTRIYGGGAAGGIVGSVQGQNASVSRFENNENKGKITCDSSTGGIVGFASRSFTIKDCVHSGIVESTATQSGGIIGLISKNNDSKIKITIDHCSVIGEISDICGRYTGNENAANAAYMNLPVIEISSLEDFMMLSKAIKEEKYRLLNDLDLSNIEWVEMDFSATLDGGGHKISGLNQPLFNVITGEVHHLTVDVDINITNTSGNFIRIGGLTKEISGGIVHDVIIEGAIVAQGEKIDTGGVAGNVFDEKTQIYNCINQATISGVYSSAGGATGGIVGAIHACIKFENNINEGDVTSISIAGGMIGLYDTSKKTLNIADCVNKGNISGTGHSIGGIVGCSVTATTITRGKMTGTSAGGKYAGDNNVTYVDLAPVEVTKPQDLLDLIHHIPAERYILMNDIDMNGIEWTPFEFKAVFDGNHYAIKNLTVQASSGNLGMFTALSGSISNVVLEDLTITSTSATVVSVGGVCGELTGTAKGVEVYGAISGDFVNIGGITGKMTNGTIEDCKNYATVSTKFIEDASSTGGIVGTYTSGTISNCSNYGIVSSRTNYTGGIAGYAKAITFSNLKNYGEISGKIYTGGIIGKLDCGGNYSIESFTNEGNVTGTDYTAGIIGYLNNTSYSGYSSGNYVVKMTRIKNTGQITGSQYVGGIIGYMTLSGTAATGGYYCRVSLTGVDWNNTADIAGDSYIGGLMGYGTSNHNISKINDCSSNGQIQAEYYVGGLAGKLENIQLENCSNEGSSIIATGYQVDGSNFNAYIGGYVGFGYSLNECVNQVDITYNQRGSYIGGIAGYVSGAINNCTNYGNINANKSNYVGGIAGYVRLAGNSTIMVLENNGIIFGAAYVAGIIGYLNNTSYSGYSSGNYVVKMTRIKNTGQITGSQYVGGIIGYMTLSGTAATGGYYCRVSLTGADWNNTAEITGTDYIGGLMGYGTSNHPSTMVDCTQTGNVVGTGENVDNFIGSKNNITLEEME